MILQNGEQVKNGDFSLMKEIHILLCIMKGLYTQWTNDGNFKMMQACGGHGYLKSAGYAGMIDKGFAGVILEGENTVLMLQVAVEIEKTYGTVKKTGETEKVLDNLKYFADVDKFDGLCQKKFRNAGAAKFRDVDFYLNAFGKTVISLVKKTLSQRVVLVKTQKQSYKDAYDKGLGNIRITFSKLHGIYCSLRLFNESIVNFQEGPLKTALHRLALLFSIDQVQNFSSDMFAAKSLTAEDMTGLDDLYEVLLNEIHPDALVLAEGFGLPESFVAEHSVLANNDGKLYENLMNHANTYGVLNRIDVHPTMLEYIKNQKVRQVKRDSQPSPKL